MANKIDICSKALILVGANPIGSFTEDSQESRVSNSEYDDTKEALLTEYLWDFSIKQEQLGQLVAVPLFDFRYCYQIPADCLRVKLNSARYEYRVYGDKIFTNLSELKVEYQFNPDESKLPLYFIEALKYKLCEKYALAITDDKQKYEMFEAKAHKEAKKAKNIDAQNSTNNYFEDNNFWITVVR